MQPTTLTKINRLEVLRFFDTCPEDSPRHANAIVAVSGEELGAGLLKHCLERGGATVTLLEGSCTPGTRSGPRLDKWILATRDGKAVLYQVEIKNWSANSMGGRKLALAATVEEFEKHAMRRWAQVWNTGERRLLIEETRKVLNKMHTTREEIIEPVLCMWDPMHPTGHSEPLFSMLLPEDHHFKRLWFFSMSAYLRTLDEDEIEIEMPNTLRRLHWLKLLLPYT
jgi:hypothetical protein